MKKVIRQVILMCLLMMAFIFSGSYGVKGGDAETDISFQNDTTIHGLPDIGSYNKGFNDALDCISLLNLELRLKNERKTFGEMSQICKDRFRVPKV